MSRRPVVGTAVAALVCALVLTHGLWAAPGTTEIAGNAHDIDLYTSFLQHAAYSVAHLHDPFYIRTLNAPVGVNAMWNTTLILPGLVLSPLTLTAGPLATYNVLILVSFTGTAAGTHVLLRRFVAHGAAAVFGAFLWTFSPVIVAAQLGHASYAFTPLVPLILLAVDDVLRGAGSARWAGVRLGLLCVAQLLTGEELLAQAGIFAVLLLALLAARSPRAVRPVARRVGEAAAWAALAFGVLAAYPLWVQFGGPLGQHGTPFPGDYFVADVLSFVSPSGQYLVATQAEAQFARQYGGGLPEYGSYLGLPLILAVLVSFGALVRRPLALALGVTTALLVVASLGGHLLVNGDHTTTRLPWYFLKQLPVLEAALPNRFAMMVALAVAGLAALGLDRALSAGASWWLGVAGASVVAVVVTLLPTPYTTMATQGIPPFFDHVTDVLPRGTTALVLPYPDPGDTEPERWQAESDDAFSMPGGYFIGPNADGQAAINLSEFPLPSAAMFAQIETSAVLPAIGDRERAQFTADLAAWHAQAIIVGSCRNVDLVLKAITQLLGRDPVLGGGVAVWRL